MTQSQTPPRRATPRKKRHRQASITMRINNNGTMTVHGRNLRGSDLRLLFPPKKDEGV